MKTIYRGYEIEIIGQHGNGSYYAPMTNVPYGFIITLNGEYVNGYYKMSSTENGALEVGKQWVNRMIKRNTQALEEEYPG